jgi:CheY-like chemotaxis protein
MPTPQILVADDDPIFTRLITASLRTKGWTVIAAVDAMQALMYAIRSQPDAILLDINMPGGTGIKTLQQLKASSKTVHIPVVVMTGLADPTLAATVASLGADGFVPKPIDLDAMHRTLQTLMGVSAG